MMSLAAIEYENKRAARRSRAQGILPTFINEAFKTK